MRVLLCKDAHNKQVFKLYIIVCKWQVYIKIYDHLKMYVQFYSFVSSPVGSLCHTRVKVCSKGGAKYIIGEIIAKDNLNIENLMQTFEIFLLLNY